MSDVKMNINSRHTDVQIEMESKSREEIPFAISGLKELGATFDADKRQKDLNVRIQESDHRELSFVITGRSDRKKPYDGPYSVASLANEMQLFETENKVMTENLVVLPIPYYETSNPRGGLTVYIGGD